MVEREGFVEATRRSPDDLALRLVYADWLEDQDDPLAEFIRVQVELEPLRHAFDRPDVQALLKREQNLLGKRQRTWQAGLNSLMRKRELHITYRRGLIERARLSAACYCENHQLLHDRCPALHELTLTQVRDGVGDLAACPRYGPVKRLALADWLSPRQTKRLLGSPLLRGVESLTLWLGHEADREVAHVFAKADLPAMRQLKLIQLRGGLQSGKDGPRLAARADDIAHKFNQARGEPIATVERPFRRRFPLYGDMGYGIVAGHLSSGEGALAYPGERELFVAVFQKDGGFLRLERKRHKEPDEFDVEEKATELFGFSTGLIRVHEFTTNPAIPRRRAAWFMESANRPPEKDMAVLQWPSYFGLIVDSPDLPLNGCSSKEWREAASGVNDWMEDGDYMIDCWNDYWGGAEGEITAS